MGIFLLHDSKSFLNERLSWEHLEFPQSTMLICIQCDVMGKDRNIYDVLRRQVRESGSFSGQVNKLQVVTGGPLSGSKL